MKKLLSVVFILMLIFSVGFSEEYVDNSSAVDLSNITVVEPKPTPNPNRHINVYVVNAKEKYEFGETITFAAELVGYEWCENMTYQWQILQNGKWQNIDGANDLTYTLTITKENCQCEWRIEVTCYL